MGADGHRLERDSLGEVKVPEGRLWGAQTQRAIGNFPVSGQTMPTEIVHALALLKKCCAQENKGRGLLDPTLADAIVTAAIEVARGDHDAEFPVDIFQTGSGTSTNMNVNEVIANRAIALLGGTVGSKTPVHPNDHVNRGQSSNDAFPTALHLAALRGLTTQLVPALAHLKVVLERKAAAFDHVVKVGRTHLMDAVPIRMGQEVAGWASMVGHAQRRIEQACGPLSQLPLGGTAVGTGLGAPRDFAPSVIARLAGETGLPLTQAPDLREALGAREAMVEASGALRAAAVGFVKIANDVRWLGSGPRAGLGELRLPELQAGSSIMPAKVNPVMCEMLLMVSARVIGADQIVAACAASGNFELNVSMPLMGYELCFAIQILSRAVTLFADRCIAGLEVDEARCRELAEGSLALATALVPRIGYDRAAELARAAADRGTTVRAIAVERAVLPLSELDALLDPRRMTEPD